ncbi:FAD:protein FMN transferase [Rhizobium sp. C4]|uniref:FAD:protein FMN transferase n=1 Tax=Rhizobium sp. C4 TaxID=1349800 RepID=UPI001E30B6CA|nr:FAD:protein FMN transferase [Rhizobium sp. C4]MCD2175151.1 FAD:protein FMN transferase [Rhizobium sp. C4]
MTQIFTKPVTRRRALFIGAVLVAGAAIPSAILAPRAFAAKPVRWSGQALGAHAEIELLGASEAEARPVLAAVEAEIARLEVIFSLYRQDSALARLNRDGALADPPPELLEVLALSRAVHGQTNGLFDPTVQPLFAFYAEWFTKPHRARLPEASELAPVLARVGMDKVIFDDIGIAFSQPGMALTLNGIAQGYITDRISALLKSHGYGNMLLDIGEIQAVGKGRNGAGWQVGIRKGVSGPEIAERLTLSDQAVATSMMLGTTFDNRGHAGHILHPMKGLTRDYTPRASVIHPSAAFADAMSTAVVLMDVVEIERMRASGQDIRV